MKDICIDTGFLIGLYDEGDHFHDTATKYFIDLFESGENRLLVPWPILYETIRTKMVSKNRRGMERLQKDWKRLRAANRLELLSDTSFRSSVVEECFEELGKPPGRYRALSAVDRVIRHILSDTSLRIHAFITCNPEDFADVCGKFKRELMC